MIVTFTCLYSDTPAKIGTLVSRTLKLTSPSVPETDFDQVRKLSIDKTASARSVVSQFRTIKVDYIFPASELYLDDEFRKSAGELTSFEIDGTSNSNIGEVLTVSMDPEKVSTTEEGDYRRRSFTVTVFN